MMRLWIGRGLIGVCLLAAGQVATGQVATKAGNKETVAMKHVSGAFDVKMTPQAADEGGGGVGRMLLDKTFHGALEASSKGQMLAAMTAVKGSAAYVAIEIVTGSLDGRAGTFALVHTGVMNKGVPSLTVTVVPDSGTGELVGLSGQMAIDVVGGKHAYGFDYSLPGAN